MPILAPVSAGELIDKITILRVKALRIGDPAKEANVKPNWPCWRKPPRASTCRIRPSWRT
jgi:hypothetical protein